MQLDRRQEISSPIERAEKGESTCSRTVQDRSQLRGASLQLLFLSEECLCRSDCQFRSLVNGLMRCIDCGERILHLRP